MPKDKPKTPTHNMSGMERRSASAADGALDASESSSPSRRRTVKEPFEMEYVASDVGEMDAILYPTMEIEEETWLPRSLQDWMYPPGVPRECQLLRKENIAIPACYLLVGLLQGLSAPLVNVYPLELGASEAQQVTVSSIRGIPATFKLAFGFLSDNVPLGGYRRKSYMFLGWLVASLSMITLATFSDLSMDKENGPSV